MSLRPFFLRRVHAPAPGMKSYSRTLASLTVCAAFGLGAGACGGGSADPGSTGSAGDSGTARRIGAGGTTGNGGTTGSAGTAGSGGRTAARQRRIDRHRRRAARPGDLFVSLPGKTPADVSAKLTTAVNRFFGIGTGESTTPTGATGYRCYYELPQDASMAFIWAADSDDVRSEGMSYGMMIAVQMNMQTQFDRLWKFAKTYMQFPATSSTTAWRNYFRWQGTVNRSDATSWTATFGDTGPAPDGDEYFAAALYLAHRRWGSAGDNDYKLEADNIAAAMLHNPSTSSTAADHHPRQREHARVRSPGRLGELHRSQLPPAGVL